MESSTLIKLRQKEATNITQNGAYNISLKESVTLEQGDVVKLHTAILDTSTESFITLENDTPISVDVATYVRNYTLDAPLTQHFQKQLPSPIEASQPDLNLLMPCFENAITGDHYKLLSFTCFARRAGKTKEITIEYSFRDPVTGLSTTGSVVVPPFAGISHASKGFVVPINRLILGRNVVLLNTNADLESHHIADGSGAETAPFFDVPQTPVPSPSGNEVHNQLFTRTLDWTIPAGRYYPAEIATIINDEMSQLDSLGTLGYDVALNKYPVESPFLQTFHQVNHLVTGGEADGGIDKPLNYNPSVVTLTEDPTDLCQFDVTDLTSTNDPVFGANEVSLNYDDNLKKLNFDALHFPFYVGTGGAGGGGQPGTKYPPLPPTYLAPNPAEGQPGHNSAIPHIPQTCYAGVFFTKMTPVDFWTRQLGFVNLIVTPEISDALITGRKDNQIPVSQTMADIYPVKVFLTPGVNIVTAFNGLDNIIPKTDTAYIPTLGEVATTLTTPIISSREFDTPHNDEGYYLIEVGMNIPQKMIGGAIAENTTSNKVQGIMGKYFTSGNFLQSQGQGAIVYEHEGDPVLLSDLAVTIRNPDMTLPADNDLGEKNSIFLEVIKQVPAPQQS